MARAIFISGVIGSGKTTLAEKISKKYGLKLRQEDVQDDIIVPKIHEFYSNFDPDIIYEVQSHFLQDSRGLSEGLTSGEVYVFDTYPFVSQMVFIETLRILQMISIEQFESLRAQLLNKISDISFISHLHIHCATPPDIFDRILKRNSFEVNSFDNMGLPSPTLIRLIEELDIAYYDLALTQETLFSEDPALSNKLKQFVDGRE